MSDEPQALPSLAEAAQLDEEALKRWFDLPEDSLLELHATRGDFDALFLGLRNTLFAQGGAMAALQSYTQGQNERGAEQFDEAAKQHVVALTFISRFISGIMAKASPYER